jgi:hypothetical protein
MLPVPTESPKRSPNVLSDDREASPLVPIQRLPQPEPRPRLPVRVASYRAWLVKAAQVVVRGGRGAFIEAKRRALTAMLHLQRRTGGNTHDPEPSLPWVERKNCLCAFAMV